MGHEFKREATIFEFFLVFFYSYFFFPTVLVGREHIGDHEFGDEERRYDPISRIRKAGLREEAQLSKNLFHIFPEALGHLFL